MSPNDTSKQDQSTMLNERDLDLIERSIEGKLSEQENSELSDLCRQNPDAGTYLADAQKIQLIFDEAQDEISGVDLTDLVLKKASYQTPSKKRMGRPQWALAASIFVGLGFVGALTLMDPPSPSNVQLVGTMMKSGEPLMISQALTIEQSSQNQIELAVNTRLSWTLTLSSQDVEFQALSRAPNTFVSTASIALTLSGTGPSAEILRVVSSPNSTAQIKVSFKLADQEATESVFGLTTN